VWKFKLTHYLAFTSGADRASSSGQRYAVGRAWSRVSPSTTLISMRFLPR